MHNIDHDVQLLRAYLKGETHPDSNPALRELLAKYPDLSEFATKLDSEKGLKNLLEKYQSVDNEDGNNGEDRVLQNILSRIRQENRPRVVSFNWKKAAVAAGIAAILFIAFQFFNGRFTNTVQTEQYDIASFAPGTSKALLTTSDGRQVELDSHYKGIVIGDRLLYEDGSELFEGDSIGHDITLTLRTPRGGQYQVSLPDGTKVWLNADSKLHYPRTFAGKIRAVEVQGEAYFEVASDAEKPFIVQTDREKIEVLGTHFNVNSYTEEAKSSVALLEGKVKVSLANQQSRVLHPGEQSLVEGNTIQVQKIDVTESVAWKNGEFMFYNESLSSVMRKLARWYDIEIEIAPDVQDITIWGSISRYENFNEVLQIIKLTDDNIQFKVEGRRVKLMK